MLGMWNQSYEDILLELKESLAWLKSLGIRTHACRFESYLSTIRKYDREWREQLPREFGPPQRDVDVSFLEASQLARIHRGLAGRIGPRERAKLKFVVQGPSHPEVELVTSASNRPRNAAFELDLLATMRNGSSSAELRDRIDIGLNHSGFRYLIECKRPQSKTAARSSLNEAASSLRAGLVAQPLAAIGVVALSVGKACGLDDKPIRAADRRELDWKLGVLKQWINLSHVNFWMQHPDSSGASAVIAQLDFVAYVGDGPLWTATQLWFFVRYDLPQLEKHCLWSLFREIRSSSVPRVLVAH